MAIRRHESIILNMKLRSIVASNDKGWTIFILRKGVDSILLIKRKDLRWLSCINLLLISDAQWRVEIIPVIQQRKITAVELKIYLLRFHRRNKDNVLTKMSKVRNRFLVQYSIKEKIEISFILHVRLWAAISSKITWVRKLFVKWSDRLQSVKL